GKITQFTFGVLHPGFPNVNLMTASVTAGAASSSADILTDMKAGYIVGASARYQFLAQIFGILSGGIVTVLVFILFTDHWAIIGGKEYSAPAVMAWKAVAELFKNGLRELTDAQQWSMLIGAIIAILISVGEYYAPKKYRVFVP